MPPRDHEGLVCQHPNAPVVVLIEGLEMTIRLVAVCKRYRSPPIPRMDLSMTWYRPGWGLVDSERAQALGNLGEAHTACDFVGRSPSPGAKGNDLRPWPGC